MHIALSQGKPPEAGASLGSLFCEQGSDVPFWGRFHLTRVLLPGFSPLVPPPFTVRTALLWAAGSRPPCGDEAESQTQILALMLLIKYYDWNM